MPFIGRAFSSRLFCEHDRLRAVYLNCRAVVVGFGTNESRSLAVIWFYATRLETRTKESDACASLRVTETLRRNESEDECLTRRGEIRPTPVRRIIVRPFLLLERFEKEHTCWDPKDGELCLSRAKPEETLVEARSDSDVQIDRQT